jgi:hypothetical protein
MRHVDALSRNPSIPEQAVHGVTYSEEDWLLAAQQGDKELHRVREILESGEWEANKNVCSITKYGLRWVVPKAAKFQILRMAYDDAGHFAFDKTHELISRQYWFPRMRRFIKKYIDNCLNCIYFKTPAGKPQGSLYPIPKIAVPFHTVHIDHVGPFVKSRQGNIEILVAVDIFTKFVLLYPVKTTRAKQKVKVLKDLTKNFGVPHRIISDGAKSFVGKVFTDFCQKRKIRHYVNAPSLPRANGGNGQVERYSRTLLSALANIDNIQLGTNGTINRAIGVTPSEALMGIRVSANRMLELGGSNEWDQGEKGRMTHSIIREVDRKLRGWNYKTVCRLTGHGPFRGYLRRFNLTETAGECVCSTGAQDTTQHIIGECGDPGRQEARERWRRRQAATGGTFPFQVTEQTKEEVKNFNRFAEEVNMEGEMETSG